MPGRGAVDSAEVMRLFTEALPLAERIAKRYGRAHDWRFEVDDLVGAARQGLLEAARRFDPVRGVPFEAYARLRIRGSVIAEIRGKVDVTEGAYRRAVALRTAASGAAHEVSIAAQELAVLRGREISGAEAERQLDELMASYVTAAAIGLVSAKKDADVPEAKDLEDEVASRELMGLVASEMAEMDEREAAVVQGRYFLDKTIDDLAAEWGCDRSWVSRIHRKAITRIARRLRAGDGAWS